MISVEKYLLFVFFCLSVNLVSANSIPPDVAAACGEKSCDLIFKKMQKFAKNGSPHAQAVLALFYRSGYGTEIDHELSVRYIKRAAKNRVALAQYDLGILYRIGHTVEKNEIESDFWLNRSAKAGYNKAIELLLSENKLSQEERIAYQKDRRLPTIGEGEELIVITKEQFTLSDLVGHLNSLGYSRNTHTGSRIRGRGCGNHISWCIIVKVKANSPVGGTPFARMIRKINAIGRR